MRREFTVSRLERREAGHVPTLDAVARWRHTRSDDAIAPRTGLEGGSVFVQISVPLFAGSGVESRLREALAEAGRQRALEDATQLDLRQRVRHALATVDGDTAREAALTTALRAADQAQVSAQRSLRACA